MKIWWKQVHEDVGAYANNDNYRSSHTSLLVR